jgi:ferric-dicitrate binding protein FerR (iron transport regulator)
MENRYDHYKVDDLISDDAFFRLAKAHYRGDDADGAWVRLLSSHTEEKEAMERAYILINSIRIEESPLSGAVVQKEWLLLEKRIKQRRNKRLLYWASSVAACFLLAMSGLYFLDDSFSSSQTNKQELLTRLAETHEESTDIQIITGDNRKTTIDRDATIIEKEDGSIIVNDDQTITAGGNESAYIEVYVPKGKRSYIELKDGSKIWINSGTRLLYPSSFDAKKREIYVNGEIYLEVAKKETHPFFVHTAQLDVRVVGTAFNITAYQDDSFTDVVLVNGSVEVYTTKNETTKLTPNTRYTLEEGQAARTEPVDVYNYICWKEGVMKVDGEALQGILKRLSRYYNVTIVVPPEIGNIRYYGKLSMEETIENVLYNISLAEPVLYKREGDSIRIHSTNMNMN